MSMIFKTGKYLVILEKKTLIKPLYKKGDKTECGNYKSICSRAE